MVRLLDFIKVEFRLEMSPKRKPLAKAHALFLQGFRRWGKIHINSSVLRSRSGCKNSGKIWWMMKFQNMETLTPVLLMKFFRAHIQEA